MPKDFIFPDVGEGIHEGKIVKWHAKVGDFVKADSTIVEVETDKAIVELPSPATGTVLKINHKSGEIVKVGEVLVVIGSKDESLQSDLKSDSQVSQTVLTKPDPSSITTIASSGSTLSVLATPSTRKLARDLGIDLTKIKGSGPNGSLNNSF
jgi:pyruvate dehydrogenase E2 component (dihydrolipoamide acetyltransferase)